MKLAARRVLPVAFVAAAVATVGFAIWFKSLERKEAERFTVPARCTECGELFTFIKPSDVGETCPQCKSGTLERSSREAWEAAAEAAKRKLLQEQEQQQLPMREPIDP